MYLNDLECACLIISEPMGCLIKNVPKVQLGYQVDISGDLVPASSPSALMWAQWASAQQAARVMLDAGDTWQLVSGT